MSSGWTGINGPSGGRKRKGGGKRKETREVWAFALANPNGAIRFSPSHSSEVTKGFYLEPSSRFLLFLECNKKVYSGTRVKVQELNACLASSLLGFDFQHPIWTPNNS